MVDIIEILVHWHAGRSNSEIAQSLDVDRKKVRKYIATAQAAGMVPGGPPVTEERWAELVQEWFPELALSRTAPRRSASHCRAASPAGRPSIQRRFDWSAQGPRLAGPSSFRDGIQRRLGPSCR